MRRSLPPDKQQYWIDKLKSPNNEESTQAHKFLTDNSWLSEGPLTGANFQGQDLQNLNLKGVKLQQANLSNTNLTKTNLSEANLNAVDLCNAILTNTNFYRANIVNADFSGASFSQQTILPDKTLWHADVIITRYTNPDHPEFYAPEWVIAKAPSYWEWYYRITGR